MPIGTCTGTTGTRPGLQRNHQSRSSFYERNLTGIAGDTLRAMRAGDGDDDDSSPPSEDDEPPRRVDPWAEPHADDAPNTGQSVGDADILGAEILSIRDVAVDS